MSARHTEGPWFVIGDDEVPDGVPVIEISTALGAGYKQICYVQPCDNEPSGFEIKAEDRANARLIAAAPETKAQRDELLEALKRLVSTAQGLKVSHQVADVTPGRAVRLKDQIERADLVLESARAAIARAEEG